jgi:hypothetical protein
VTRSARTRAIAETIKALALLVGAWLLTGSMLTGLACALHMTTSQVTSHIRTAGVNVRDYGAKGDGMTDDRAAIQAAIDAGSGSTVVFPAGRYLVSQAPSAAGSWDLHVSGAQTSLLGEPGAILAQMAGTSPNVRLLHVDAANVSIRGLVLDGQKALQTPGEHRAGVFATGATGLELSDLTAQNFYGDGIYVHIGSNNVRLTRVSAIGNVRNGLTLGGGTVGAEVVNSEFLQNGVQQADSEPGGGTHVDSVSFTGCTFDGRGVGGDYVLTVSGGSSALADASRDWTIEGNTINGGINVVWAIGVAIRGNRGVNTTIKPSLTVYRSSDQVQVTDNVFLSAGSAPSVIEVLGTAEVGQQPNHIALERNLVSTRNVAFGMSIRAARAVTVTGNVIRGPGLAAAFNAGVLARATVAGLTTDSVVVRGNTISNFGAYGVSASSSPGKLGLVDVTGNIFDDSTGSMPSAMTFDTAHDVRQSDNLALGGVTTMVLHAPSGATRTSWGTGDRWVTP